MLSWKKKVMKNPFAFAIRACRSLWKGIHVHALFYKICIKFGIVSCTSLPLYVLTSWRLLNGDVTFLPIIVYSKGDNFSFKTCQLFAAIKLIFELVLSISSYHSVPIDAFFLWKFVFTSLTKHENDLTSSHKSSFIYSYYLFTKIF